MPIPNLITDLTTTAATNSPAGGESVTTTDDYLRAQGAFIAQLRDNTGFTTAPRAASGANADITSLGSLASINGGQIAGNRNRIVNGDTRIWQRGTGFTGIGPTPIYTTDRFTVACNGGVVSVSQGGAPTGGYLALSINGAAGVTNVQAQTKLESLNVYDLGGGQITVSGYVFQSTGAAISSALLKVFRANAVDNFSAVTQEGTSYTLPSIPSATWTFFKATFSVSSAAANGISITLDSGTPVVAGQSFATTLWQCERGSAATAFEYRDLPSELVRCQRYFLSAGMQIFRHAAAAGTAFSFPSVWFPVSMRTSPTTVLTAATLSNCTAPNISADSVNSARPSATSVAVGEIGFTSASFTASAEL